MMLYMSVFSTVHCKRAILKASNLGIPVTNDYQSDAGMAYNDAIKRLLGKKVPMRFIQSPKQSFFNKLFKRTAV